MANLQYGDLVKLPNNTLGINNIHNVVPMRFNTIQESWEVCEQNKATHMLIIMDTVSIVEDYCDGGKMRYAMIEIGKCKNLYLLADAIVD